MSDKELTKLNTRQAVAHPSLNTNQYIKAATSNNTRKAYQSDMKHFESWGGKLPTSPEVLAKYIGEYATTLNPRTISRRLVAIKHWHHYQGFADPTSHPAIVKTLAGIKRVHGKPKKKARALTPTELQKITTKLTRDGSLVALRDAALLQIGLFGAFRRSELIQIQFEDLRFEDEGIEITLSHSKTDQDHEGQFVVIPVGNEQLCPVGTLQAWLNAANITSGYLFKQIISNKHLAEGHLSAGSVNTILKKRAEEAGIENADEFSSHSMRRGLATSAARAGAPIQSIMRAGRWKQVNTVMEYIEASERFTENAAKNVLNTIDEAT